MTSHRRVTPGDQSGVVGLRRRDPVQSVRGVPSLRGGARAAARTSSARQFGRARRQRVGPPRAFRDHARAVRPRVRPGIGRPRPRGAGGRRARAARRRGASGDGDRARSGEGGGTVDGVPDQQRVRRRRRLGRRCPPRRGSGDGPLRRRPGVEQAGRAQARAGVLRARLRAPRRRRRTSACSSTTSASTSSRPARWAWRRSRSATRPWRSPNWVPCSVSTWPEEGQSGRVRRDDTTPVSKPARCSPPWKRACSILRQRFITTRRPAAWAIPAASSDHSPSWNHSVLHAAEGDDLAGHRGELIAAPEDVDEVGWLRAGRRGSGTPAGRGSRPPAGSRTTPRRRSSSTTRGRWRRSGSPGSDSPTSRGSRRFACRAGWPGVPAPSAAAIPTVRR